MNKTNKEIRFAEHEVISVPHQMPIKCWTCKSFEEAAINILGWDYDRCDNMADAIERFGCAEDVPHELAELLKTGPAVYVYDYTGNYDYYVSADEFDPERAAREYCAHDDHTMIVMDSLADAQWELEHYRGHREIEVKCAIERIIEKYQQDAE